MHYEFLSQLSNLSLWKLYYTKLFNVEFRKHNS